MKAIWKVLIGAAAVAAVAPYKVEKDEETGAIKLKAATWAATYTSGENGKNIDVKLLPALHRNSECECCREDEDRCRDESGEESDGGITIEVDAEPEAEEVKDEEPKDGESGSGEMKFGEE